MNLKRKKILATKVLGVGKERIIFNKNSLQDIKDALTRQDIKDLLAAGAISIRAAKGRKKIEKKSARRRAGSRRKIVIDKKRRYINLTRKLRAYLAELRKKELVSNEVYFKLRQEIKASAFADKIHLKERIRELKQ
jgi:large subunit ribosomal protein L19e